MHRYLTTAVLLLAVAGPLADEGRIPIWEPTAITAPGSYVLTRDISGAGTILSISSDGVDLDLNGFTLVGEAADVVVVSVAPDAPQAGVRIHGGSITGGFAGIYCPGIDELSLSVFDMAFAGQGEFAVNCSPPGFYRIEGVEITGAVFGGLSLGSSSPSRMVVRDNTVRDVTGFGLVLGNADGSEISGNRIVGFGNPTSSGFHGIVLNSSPLSGHANRVTDNVVQNGVSEADGIRIINNAGTLVHGNVVRDADGYGIHLDSSDNCRVTNNVATGNTLSGLFSGGINNYLERNSSQGNGAWGLSCGGNGLWFRENLLLTNTLGGLDSSAVCDFAADAGGNIR